VTEADLYAAMSAYYDRNGLAAAADTDIAAATAADPDIGSHFGK